MSTETPATETTKNAIENAVNWFLADKLQDPVVTIATKKYSTNDNLLLYLTHCNVAETSVPRIKVQVYQRISGGVKETAYQIFSDHRMTKLENHMLFGHKPGEVKDNPSQDVVETEATSLLQLINSLTEARQTP